MVSGPRVRPRTAIADRVDKELHALPPTIPTEDDAQGFASGVHWTTIAALVLLAVFVAALPLAGFLGLLEGRSVGVGFLGLAVSTLTASYLLGSD